MVDLEIGRKSGEEEGGGAEVKILKEKLLEKIESLKTVYKNQLT